MKSIVPILFILVAVGVFFVFIDPEYNNVKELQTEIEKNNETLDLARELREKRESLRERYNQISDQERDELIKLLPDTVDNVRLIIDINNIAEKYGIVIRDIVINSDDGGSSASDVQVAPSAFEGVIEQGSLEYPDTSRIGVISFSFSAETEYEVFIDFLSDLEKSLRIVDVREIEIQTRNLEDSIYDYRIKLDTYWLK